MSSRAEAGEEVTEPGTEEGPGAAEIRGRGDPAPGPGGEQPPPRANPLQTGACWPGGPGRSAPRTAARAAGRGLAARGRRAAPHKRQLQRDRRAHTRASPKRPGAGICRAGPAAAPWPGPAAGRRALQCQVSGRRALGSNPRRANGVMQAAGSGEPGKGAAGEPGTGWQRSPRCRLERSCPALSAPVRCGAGRGRARVRPWRGGGALLRAGAGPGARALSELHQLPWHSGTAPPTSAPLQPGGSLYANQTRLALHPVTTHTRSPLLSCLWRSKKRPANTPAQMDLSQLMRIAKGADFSPAPSANSLLSGGKGIPPQGLAELKGVS